jgi:hypothetical protein
MISLFACCSIMRINCLRYNWGIQSVGSIFSTIPTMLSGPSVTWSGGGNGFYNSFGGATFGGTPISIPSNPFQAAGAGEYYLDQANTYVINRGPTLVNPLLGELQKRTTCMPTLKQGVTISSPEAWPKVATRDTDQFDLGYHYPAVDYLANLVTVGATTLTLNEGVSVATFGCVMRLCSVSSTLRRSGSSPVVRSVC